MTERDKDMMNKNIKKILAGAAALALLLGNFTGTGFTVVKAESFEMPVIVKDKETDQPVEGIFLMLKGPEGEDNIVFEEPTDEEGYVLYEPFDLKSEVEYQLTTAEDSGYTCTNPMEVVGGRDYFGPYIDTVNGKPYDGEDITLTVEDNGGDKPVIPELSSISSSIDEVSRDGGEAVITVNGENLPEEAYCQLWYESANGTQVQLSDDIVAMTGNDAQKLFTIAIPSSLQYPKAVTWIVRVSLDNGAQGWDSAVIKVAEEAK